MNALRVISTLAVLVGVAGMASADEWAASSSGDWDVNANWADNSAPTSADNANFATSNPGAAYTVSLTQAQSCAFAGLGTASGGDNMILDLNGFDLSGTRLHVGDGAAANTTATIIGDGGTINILAAGSNGFKMGGASTGTTQALTLDNVTVDLNGNATGQFCLGRSTEIDNLTVQNGAFVNAYNLGYRAEWGYSTSAVNVLIKDANSKIKVSNSMYLGGTNTNNGVAITVESGGELEVTLSLLIGYQATNVASSVTVGRTGSATLTVGRNLDISSATGNGILALGIGGTVTTATLATAATGVLELDFDDVDGGQITATGNVNLTGAEFDFTNIGGLNSSGDTIDFIVTATTIATDAILDHDLDSVMGSTSYTFGVVSLGGGGEALRLTYVPEPATLGLLCMGGVLALLRRRQK